ncbi:hypothetical protein K458DRAFT_286821 [Lentithecium fluviatile CBS 122367]|uniref:Rhodopsin domain-containing protein n=1 Tax=Lentithecium fluviatile CBS 122367 TaxID=1168545 RepID=A0A6G1JMS6_9PLEO|nr:hypothetical protein K458DRAFT_286821 [Lentithecium fluviatile CBS 122367]
MSAPIISYPKENEGPKVLGATLAITIVALITMIARLYVRLRMIRNVGWDDYFMCMAMLLCIAGECVVIPQVYYGAGKHIDQIEPLDFQMAFKLNFISQPIYLFAIMLVKESIGFFLLRIATLPFYRKTIISIMVFMGAYTVACFITIVLQCTNLAVQWDPTAKGTCWTATTLKALGYTNVSLNILTDVLFAIVIPIPMLWHVQMNRRQKSSVIGILALGIFATAAALVKVGYLPNYGKTGDWLWDSRNITIWTIMECNVGIIAGNLPCLKPIFRSVLGSTYGRGSRKTNSKPISRPYGAGTNPRSGTNDAYNSLASSKGNNGRPLSPYAAYEAHIMTTIKGDKSGADKSRSESPTSMRADSSPGNRSAESIELLDDQQPKSFLKMGGILKTTEVSQERDVEEGLRPERKATHMV